MRKIVTQTQTQMREHQEVRIRECVAWEKEATDGQFYRQGLLGSFTYSNQQWLVRTHLDYYNRGN